MPEDAKRRAAAVRSRVRGDATERYVPTLPPREYPIPIQHLVDHPGFYTVAEIAKAVNNHPADVQSAIDSAILRGQVETRDRHGKTQVR